MIAAIRLTSFYVGVEEYDNPALLSRPFVVTLPARHNLSTVFACSAAATARGLRPGQLLTEAQAGCPELAHMSARLPRYAEVSRRLMEVLATISPQLEVVALDEVYLDLTSCQSYYRYQPERMARLIRETLHDCLPFACGIGIAGDKTSARHAAVQGAGSASGIGIIAPEQAEAALAVQALQEVFDTGAELQQFLLDHGISRCGDLKKLPASVLQHRFGPLGTQLWLMSQGKDPRPVQVAAALPEDAIQVGKLLPPETRDGAVVLFQLHMLSEKLALQLARKAEAANAFQFSLRCAQGWRQEQVQLPTATHDAAIIFQLGRKFLKRHWLGEAVLQLRILACKPSVAPGQGDIFAYAEPRRRQERRPSR